MAGTSATIAQTPSSTINTNAAGTGTYSTYTGILTGDPTLSTTYVGNIGSSVAVPASTTTVQTILTPGGGSITQTIVNQMANQPATTPPAANTTALVTLEEDEYRYGGKGETASISGDTMATPDTAYGRQLGESPNDDPASIFLSSQFPTDTFNPEADPQGNILNAYSRFFLQSVQETQAEKFQIVETFTDYYTFFYGKRPPIYRFTGMLLNDENFKWTNDMMFFYENFLRGSQTVALGAQAYVNYSGRLVSGFLLGMSIQEESVLYKGASFSFDVLIVTHTPLYFSVDIASLIANATQTLNAQKVLIQNQIDQINASVAPGQATLAALSASNGITRSVSVVTTGATVTPSAVNLTSGL